MDTPTDTPPAASTSLSHASSVDTKCASNPLKRPRGDAAASGRCSVCQMDLSTETDDRSYLFKLEKLNLVSTDPKVSCPPTSNVPISRGGPSPPPDLPVPTGVPRS